MNQAILTEFLGWTTVINCGILLLTSFLLLTMRGPIKRIHGSLFDLDGKTLDHTYFQYLARYKVLVLTLNLAPYLALKLMA
ncbi:MAG: DUF6868 family protein [Planctomycetota bacterium]|jgi:hypothetical protein